MFCRLCLATEVKVFDINAIADLCLVYKQLVSLKDLGTIKYYACYECFGLLQKCLRFQYKCHRSLQILEQIKINKGIITLQSIKDFNRENGKLSLSLAVSETLYVTCEPSVTTVTENEVVKLEPTGNINEYIGLEYFDIDIHHDNSDINESHNDVDAIVPIKSDFKHEPDIETIKIEFDNATVLPVNASPEPKKATSKRSKQKEGGTPRRESTKKNKLVKPERKRKKVESCLEGYATVIKLSTEEAKNEILLRKESKKYKYRALKCNLCYRAFTVEAAYNNHMKQHSSEYGDYECMFCYLRFASSPRMKRHLRQNHKRKFLCKMCPYVCGNQTQAGCHMRTHTGKVYTCDVCNAQFKMSHCLSTHKQKRHIETWQHVCSFCGKHFALLNGLNLHIKRRHLLQANTELLGPNCEECNIKFASELAWKRHLVLSSTHKVSNGCVVCGETFLDARSLRFHLKTHPAIKANYNKKPITPPSHKVCEICTLKLSNMNAYEYHLVTKHPDSELTKQKCSGNMPFVCDVCGKMFRIKSYLRAHLQAHNEDRPFKCEECGKTFSNKYILNYHRQNMHLTKELWKCDQCPREFRFSNSLSRHVKSTHLGMKPHKCTLCESAFLNACQVRKHMRHVHDRVPWPKRDREGEKLRRREKQSSSSTVLPSE